MAMGISRVENSDDHGNNTNTDLARIKLGPISIVKRLRHRIHRRHALASCHNVTGGIADEVRLNIGGETFDGFDIGGCDRETDG